MPHRTAVSAVPKPAFIPTPLSAAARRALGPQDAELVGSVMAEAMHFMPAPEFARSNAERKIFTEAPSIRRPKVDWYCPLMHEERALGRGSDSMILTGAQERVLFMQFNYARYRVARIQKAQRGQALETREAREVLHWAHAATRLRDQIAEINLGLVLAMAKRVRNADIEFADLISEGNMALMRAVDKFDCGRGFKFSTYACRAILKAFSRHGIKQSKHRQRFPTEFDPAMERGDHAGVVRAQHESECASEVGWLLESNRADLTALEREVIECRFGINAPIESALPTLEQIGASLGVTKERVRQIQIRALEKLRSAYLNRVERRSGVAPADEVLTLN
jgi:RNA polymerase sigma factor (sigma-70 family)